MMISKQQISPQNQRLRKRLDDFYQLAEDALCRTYSNDGFSSICVSLSAELTDLCSLLSSLEAKYIEELPLVSEEPINVYWITEMERMNEMAEKTVLHEGELRSFSEMLKQQMQDAGQIMERIDCSLCPEGDPDIFASYSKRMLAEYNKFKWNPQRRAIQAKITEASVAHQKERCQNLLDECLAHLKQISSMILGENDEVVYHEAIGRYIWHSVHNNAEESVIDKLLCLVKSVEYLCAKLEKKLTFLEQEAFFGMEESEAVRQETLKQKTLQNQCQVAAFRLGKLEGYFQASYTKEWIGRMLNDMVNSEYAALVCEKMKNRKLPKFIHQIAGVLKNCEVVSGCSYGDLVDALDYNRPLKSSRVDYVRHMIDDVPEIKAWLETYIVNYCESQKVSSL